jgi:hypothetical protein
MALIRIVMVTKAAGEYRQFQYALEAFATLAEVGR